MVGAFEIKEATHRGRDSSHFTAFNNPSTELGQSSNWSNNVARTTMKVHPESTDRVRFSLQG